MSAVNIAAFAVQMAFYIIVAASAAWAALTFSRYVKFMTSDEPIGADESSDVSVDEFVD